MIYSMPNLHFVKQAPNLYMRNILFGRNYRRYAMLSRDNFGFVSLTSYYMHLITDH